MLNFYIDKYTTICIIILTFLYFKIKNNILSKNDCIQNIIIYNLTFNSFGIYKICCYKNLKF